MASKMKLTMPFTPEAVYAALYLSWKTGKLKAEPTGCTNPAPFDEVDADVTFRDEKLSVQVGSTYLVANKWTERDTMLSSDEVTTLAALIKQVNELSEDAS